VSDLWIPGQEVHRMQRTMTAERMRWYADAIETSLVGHPVTAPPSIHTDDDIARAHGLPGRVADGMVSTNWLSSILVETFGDAYLRGGSLRTRYRRPITEDAAVDTVVRVRGVKEQSDERELMLDVWCETQDGERRTVGEASVPL
jgi:3-hydroxybutyryl-CoA dehydratase